jgi:hypothetical protein
VNCSTGLRSNSVEQWEFALRRERKASFCEQKEAKKLCYAGLWALSPTTPIAQQIRSFCAAFFKKRLLPFFSTP